MSRGPVAAAGGLGEVDMIVDAVAGAGMDLESATEVLDFGCSSGRARPAACRGVSAYSLAWLRSERSGNRLGQSPSHPDRVLCQSAESTVADCGGRTWTSCTRSPSGRISPRNWDLGGSTRCVECLGPVVSLLLPRTACSRSPTTPRRACGRPRNASRSWILCTEAASGMRPSSARPGDFGIVNPAWGTAFLSPEWLLTKLCPSWRILNFAPGLNQRNQDVYVLQRV